MGRSAAAVALAITLGGCVNTGAGATLPCDPVQGELDPAMVLMAQSVPTATVLPCVRTGSGDWTVGYFRAVRGRTEFHLTHVTGGEAALTVELTRTCDHSGAQETVTDHAGTRRFDKQGRRGSGFTDERLYTYPGGCTRYRYSLPGTGAEIAAAEISREVGFVSRDTLSRQVRQYSDGRLRLDPPEPA